MEAQPEFIRGFEEGQSRCGFGVKGERVPKQETRDALSMCRDITLTILC